MEHFSYHFPNKRLGKFLLKKGEIIPIHLHPEQYAMVYVLSGKAEISIYNILSKDAYEYTIELDSVCVVSEGEHQILTPIKNGHKIKAIEDTWFLDIFSPGKEVGPLSVYLSVIKENDDLIIAKSIPFEDASLPQSLLENNAVSQNVC